MIALIDPYWDSSFFQFFAIFAKRVVSLQIFSALAADELQLLTLLTIAISSALVGSFLVLRKMTMLANSLSHTTLLGIIIAHLLAWSVTGTLSLATSLSFPLLFFAALITGLLTSFCTEFLKSVLRVQEDAAIGLIFTLFFSIGVILVTLFARQSHISVEAVTGNIDLLHREDLLLSSFLLLSNILLCTLFFKEYKLISFDERYAKAVGINVPFYSYLLMFQVAATSIVAFRAVGVLLVLAFMTAPVLIARFYTDRLLSLIWLSSVFGAFISIVAIALSRHLLSSYALALSTAGLATTLLGALFILAVAVQFIKMRRVATIAPLVKGSTE